MRLSQAVSDVVNTFTPQTRHEDPKPLEWLRDIFKNIMAYASVRNISGGRQTGPTNPLFGEREEEHRVNLAHRSKETQFPSKERLPDGRHRYFMKHGMLLDRTTV